ncbi:MAG: hypothetical protein JNK82_13715 [Myxococcaceae bacterium]|nr:hypothetical protein [Myxococcaceae bacterium]
MRNFWVACAVLLGVLTGCTVPQAVQSPCVDKPMTGALGECPQCQSDLDCELLSNLCDPFAYCVHKDSSFLQPVTTCDERDQYRPPIHSCRCLSFKCDWSGRPPDP